MALPVRRASRWGRAAAHRRRFPGGAAGGPLGLSRRPHRDAGPLPGCDGASKPMAGYITSRGRELLDPRCVSRHAIDRLRELPDRGLDAAREVVDITGLADGCAAEKTVDDIAHVDEIPGGAA